MEAISKEKCSFLKNGVSGLMRVKNDEEFVEACIESCIEALDELVIVYNDCSDTTPNILEKERQKYPDKIRIFEYKDKVYAVNLTKEEFDYAQTLPDNSPHLLCNYYNFALSKVSYKFAVKIDADQIYFSGQLKKWCDICREEITSINYIRYIRGWLFNLYFMAFKQLCFRCNKAFPLLPNWIIKSFHSSYLEYAKVQVKRGKACLSLSGVNVIKDDNKWYVTLGNKNDLINILPPFNGEGDHLIFRVSENTYYEKYNMPYYNLLTSNQYSLIETFTHPYKILCMGFSWFHLNGMRQKCKEKILKVKTDNPTCFIELNNFYSAKYSWILSKVDKEMCTIRQRVLFMFIYKSDRFSIKRFATLLDKWF